MNFVGYGDDIEEEAVEQDVFSVRTEQVVPEVKSSKKSKIVNINATTQLKVVVMTPETYDEAQDIAEHLKAKKPVVVNLEGVEREVARRIIDFLGGTIFALDGQMQKISSGIFLVAPYNVGIMGDFRDELKNTGAFTW